MKKMILMCCATLLMAACSYAITPPEVVVKAFNKKFPNATKVSWGKEAAKEYEAEFTFEGKKISANFFEDGTWLETEKQIPATELPKAVQSAVKTKYPGWTIKEADMTDTAKHGAIYEVDLKMAKKKKSAAFKEDGSPVKE